MQKPLSFESKVLDKKSLTNDVIILTLQTPKEFSFSAGQFITLIIEKDGEKKPRSYSILSPPSQQGSVDLCIKIVPDGFASEVFDKTKVGDSFTVKGPFGHFIFDEQSENKEHWFIGGGTGLAPLYCMVKEYVEQKPNILFRLIISYKEKKDVLLHEELEELEMRHTNFEYIPTLTREEWRGARGRVQTHLNHELRHSTFYICGLKELVLETKELLVSKGVDPKNIKSERYS